MLPKPVVVSADDVAWESWPADLLAERGAVSWKTLISADKTSSERLTMGLAEIAPNELLHRHQHQQPECYFILAGSGQLEVAGQKQTVRAGSAVFIPSNAVHSIANTGTSALRFFYVFPTDSFQNVKYVF